jgi:hypothetical protein
MAWMPRLSSQPRTEAILGEGLDARVRCEGSLDAEHLGVRDPDGPSQCPGAHADRHTRDTQLLAGASEQISTTAGA